MDLKVLKRQYNKVAAQIHLTFQCRSPRSELHVGNVVVYFRVDETEFNVCIYTMLSSLNKTEDLYACIISSEKLGKRQRHICDDSEWRLLTEYEKEYETESFEFDVILEAEIVVTKNHFIALYEDEDLTDFELIGENGSVRFHSAVLAAASPALRRMLMGKWTETESRSLTVKDSSKETLQHLKDYLYTSKLPETGVENLLVLASYYLMTDLENKCIDKLLCNVTTENSTELARFAINNNLMKLYYSFLQLVKDGLIEVHQLKEKEYEMAMH